MAGDGAVLVRRTRPRWRPWWSSANPVHSEWLENGLFALLWRNQGVERVRILRDGLWCEYRRQPAPRGGP